MLPDFAKNPRRSAWIFLTAHPVDALQLQKPKRRPYVTKNLVFSPFPE